MPNDSLQHVADRIAGYVDRVIVRNNPNIEFDSREDGGCNFYISKNDPYQRCYVFRVPVDPLTPSSRTQIEFSMEGYVSAITAEERPYDCLSDLIKRIGHFREEMQALEAKQYHGTFELREEEPLLRVKYAIPTSTEMAIREVFNDFLIRDE